MIKRSESRQQPLVLVLVLLLAGVAFLPWDVALSRPLMDGLLPGELRSIFRRAEAFGHAYGLLAMAITIFFLDRRWVARAPRLILHGLMAGLFADVVKLMVWRTRPRYFEDLGQSTFTGTILTASREDLTNLLNSSQHSCPSAHTAVAVAAALTLARFYPAARGWFFCLAFLCAMHRVDGGAHYASDVCWGAALACISTHFLWRSSRVDSLLRRWEGPELLGAEGPVDRGARRAA